jgi:dsDNA-binding SOS-regulon protein
MCLYAYKKMLEWEELIIKTVSKLFESIDTAELENMTKFLREFSEGLDKVLEMDTSETLEKIEHLNTLNTTFQNEKNAHPIWRTPALKELEKELLACVKKSIAIKKYEEEEENEEGVIFWVGEKKITIEVFLKGIEDGDTMHIGRMLDSLSETGSTFKQAKQFLEAGMNVSDRGVKQQVIQTLTSIRGLTFEQAETLLERGMSVSDEALKQTVIENLIHIEGITFEEAKSFLERGMQSSNAETQLAVINTLGLMGEITFEEAKSFLERGMQSSNEKIKLKVIDTLPGKGITFEQAQNFLEGILTPEPEYWEHPILSWESGKFFDNAGKEVEWNVVYFWIHSTMYPDLYTPH